MLSTDTQKQIDSPRFSTADIGEHLRGAVVGYLLPVFRLLTLEAGANSIRRRIASEREGLSFCCLAQLSISDLSAGGSRSANAQRSASGFFFILAALSRR
jgi:hypothetical protein